jgi:hypothetical protein
VRQRVTRLEHCQAIDIGGRVDRPLELRALALMKSKGSPLARAAAAGRRTGSRVEIDAPHRLQRDLGGQIRRAADLEQRIALAEAPGIPTCSDRPVA